MFGKKKKPEEKSFVETADDLIEKLHVNYFRQDHKWESPLKKKFDHSSSPFEIEGLREKDPYFTELKEIIDNWSRDKFAIRQTELKREEIELKSKLRKLL